MRSARRKTAKSARLSSANQARIEAIMGAASKHHRPVSGAWVVNAALAKGLAELEKEFKVAKVLLLLAALSFAASAQDIYFTNRLATFTNLQGQALTAVELLRGDLDGVIWRKDGTGGRVGYTNIDPLLLERWGVPTNRIEVARTRAEHRAMTVAQYRAWTNQPGQVDAAAKAKADAQWAAGAPARDREAQRQADLEKIKALQQEIEVRQRQIDYPDADTQVGASSDAPLVAATTDRRSRVNTAQVQLNEATKQLDQMVADYVRKYRSQP